MTVGQENAVEQPVAPKDSPSGRPARRWWIAVLVVVVLIALVVSGILPRIHARNALAVETKEMAIPTIVVVHPKPSAPSKEIVLPANVQAYIDAPIYARTNGYLKKWYADIGARVTAGQLLAEIETPEVDQQLRQARADLATAEANLSLARITADRYVGLLKTDSVSKQDTDNAQANYSAQKATVQSGEANVKRLEELQSFEKIYAPFTGVITARRTDIGALIDSGSSGGARAELFHIAQPDRLRVYINVPEVYSGGQARPDRRSGAFRVSRTAFPGNAGSHRGGHRYQHPYPTGRNCRKQSHWHPAQWGLCGGTSQDPGRDLILHSSGHDFIVPF